MPRDVKGLYMNISIPESTEIVMELIEEDNADKLNICGSVHHA